MAEIGWAELKATGCPADAVAIAKTIRAVGYRGDRHDVLAGRSGKPCNRGDGHDALACRSCEPCNRGESGCREARGKTWAPYPNSSRGQSGFFAGAARRSGKKLRVGGRGIDSDNFFETLLRIAAPVFENPAGQARFDFGFDPLVGDVEQLAAEIRGSIHAREFVGFQ